MNNPAAANQLKEDAKSAARIIDAAIMNMYLYDKDPGLPTSDDIQLTAKALARDAVDVFFAKVGFHDAYALDWQIISQGVKPKKLQLFPSSTHER